jgi:D-serine deaminase-like pyridoxal phosphate-dependent protein
MLAEEAVAEPLAAMRARDQPGDVVEVDRVVTRLARVQSSASARGARRRPDDATFGSIVVNG